MTMQKKSLVLYKNSKSDKLHLEVFGEVNAMVVPEVKTNEAHSRITIDKSNHCYMSVLESHYKKDLAEIFTLRPAVIQLMDEIWDKLRWVPQFCVISRYGDRPLIGQIMQVVTSLPYRFDFGSGKTVFYPDVSLKVGQIVPAFEFKHRVCVYDISDLLNIVHYRPPKSDIEVVVGADGDD